MIPTIYTYIARGVDESASHLDLHVHENFEDPAAHARQLLREHRSCDRVEIWAEDRFLVIVKRPDTDRDANASAADGVGSLRIQVDD
jgi:hypothetical protein